MKFTRKVAEWYRYGGMITLLWIGYYLCIILGILEPIGLIVCTFAIPHLRVVPIVSLILGAIFSFIIDFFLAGLIRGEIMFREECLKVIPQVRRVEAKVQKIVVKQQDVKGPHKEESFDKEEIIRIEKLKPIPLKVGETYIIDKLTKTAYGFLRPGTKITVTKAYDDCCFADAEVSPGKIENVLIYNTSVKQ